MAEFGAGWVLLIIVGVLLLVGVSIYNRLVTLRNRVDNAWSQIDVQLRRRYDLIPNIVETVKGYAEHERGTFEKVVAARSAAMAAGTVQEHSSAESMLTGALKSLFALAENYPDLKANQNFMMLQEELSGTESKIAFARQFYNDSVMTFNTAQQTFPANVFARCSVSTRASTSRSRVSRASRCPCSSDRIPRQGQGGDTATVTFAPRGVCLSPIPHSASGACVIASIPYPNIDPVFLSIGPIEVRWYGIAYVLGFVAAGYLLRSLVRRWNVDLSDEDVIDVVLVAVIGLLIGARLGYVLFYGNGSTGRTRSGLPRLGRGDVVPWRFDRHHGRRCLGGARKE
jgi:LemA protein